MLITPTLVAALLVGVLAPVIRSLIWRVPFGLLSVSTVIASFVGSFLTTLTIGMVTLISFRFTTISAAEAAIASGITAGIGGLILLTLSARRLREVRGLTILCSRLLEEDAQAQALSSLHRLLARTRAASPNRYTNFVLLATGPLTQAGLWEEARDMLRQVPVESLDSAQQALRNQALATCELHFNDIDAAEVALGEIARPAPPRLETWLAATDALLLALRGHAEQALAMIPRSIEDNPSLVASYRVVRAHALANKGEREKAVAELAAVRDEAGVAGLERVVRPAGPASDLAQALLDEAPLKPD